MALNEQQQAALAEILDSDLFKRATEEVLAQADTAIGHLLAPEAGIYLAREKGTRDAFRLLRQLTKPKVTQEGLPLAQSLTRPSR